MNTHLLLPRVGLDELQLIPDHRSWLDNWLKSIDSYVESGDLASSICLQAAIAEFALYGTVITDWIGVMNTYLVRDNQPLAYSEPFGRRLYRFNQWMQSPVHAIHTHWWMDSFCGVGPRFDYRVLIEDRISTSGWLINLGVSETQTRNRMKSELFVSMLMGIEILSDSGAIDPYRTVFQGALSNEPRTMYVSAEYFRLRALEWLGSPNLSPAGLDQVVDSCVAGEGYCDFSLAGKVDDYMGTKKRIGRDVALRSPVSSLQASYVADFCGGAAAASATTRLMGFAMHISTNPLDIPAFRMRDIDTPFGTGISPVEVLAASAIVQAFGAERTDGP